VELFTVGDIAAGDVTADEATANLARYGLKAETRVIGRDGAKVESLIGAECDRWRADNVVMGAFGRGAWRETFGGVTRSLLQASPVPLVLCH
jgi:nucleotide-binding universal stress UspA family protein